MALISTSDTTQARPTTTRSSWRSAMRGLDQASIMSVELIAGILTWGGLGWLVDRWLQISPWGIIIGGMIGYAAGLYLVILRSRQMEGYAQAPTPAATETSQADGLSAAASSAPSPVIGSDADQRVGGVDGR